MSFYAKSVSFWPNEWIFKYSDKIMSCKLWSKSTSVFLNINFCAKLSNFGEKIEFREKCWFFETIVHYYWKWISYWKTCLFSENCDFLCECLYTLRNCQNMIKTSIFLRKCLFVHVSIFIKCTVLFVGKLLFWFKISFHSVIFWTKVSFLGKIYISDGINLWTNWAIFWEWC